MAKKGELTRKTKDANKRLQAAVKLLSEGKKIIEIAKILGVNQQTIRRDLAKNERLITTHNIVQNTQSLILGNDIDPIQQLYDINKMCWEILDEAKQAAIDNPKTDQTEKKLSAMKEIRAQLHLNHTILQTLFDIQHVKSFQDAVLEALDETSPALRREAIDRINKKRAVAGALGVV